MVFVSLITLNINPIFNNNDKIDIAFANAEALGQITCTAYPNCASNCPLEFCGYCFGFYMLECPNGQG